MRSFHLKTVPTSIKLYPASRSVMKILGAAMDAADPRRAVRRALNVKENTLIAGEKSYQLGNFNRVVMLSIGKASQSMAEAVYQGLGAYIHSGLVIGKTIVEKSDFPFEAIAGDHPIPGEHSLAAGEKILQRFAHLTEKDLVICTISGGGSALVTAPVHGISLGDIQALTASLLSSGATIQEINCIRKHLDHLKGGGFARQVFPATLISLIISDVVGNPLDVIASGPTAADGSTFLDAWNVIQSYPLLESTAPAIKDYLRDGVDGRHPETVKPGDPELTNVSNILIGSNQQSIAAGLTAGKNEGFQASVLTTELVGEARYVGRQLAGIIREGTLGRTRHQAPTCLIAGGETTVTIQGEGLGGRNQEVALAAVSEMDGIQDALLVTLATDGEDGPTDAAGAAVSGSSANRARHLGIDPENYLALNDAYHFFQNMNDLLVSGPTGTNVNDLTFLFF